MKILKVLIADDDKDLRKVISAYLDRFPNVVVVGEAKDGIDAVEKIERLDPDIVLMDITMPRCNGLEATRIIKSRWPSKKVIIATMHNDSFYRSEAEHAKADGFMLKSSLKASLQETFCQGSFSLGSAVSVVDAHGPVQAADVLV